MFRTRTDVQFPKPCRLSRVFVIEEEIWWSAGLGNAAHSFPSESALPQHRAGEVLTWLPTGTQKAWGHSHSQGGPWSLIQAEEGSSREY